MNFPVTVLCVCIMCGKQADMGNGRQQADMGRQQADIGRQQVDVCRQQADNWKAAG